MTDYFISDLHLGHKNILEYTTRKSRFKDLEEMHLVLLSKINETVSEKDRLVLVGDICFNTSSFKFLPMFPKNVLLVAGNHDSSQKHFDVYSKMGWRIVGAYQYDDAIVTHIPVHPMQMERFKFNIHGHTHDNHVMTETEFGGAIIRKHDKRYLNCSCEVINFTPKTYEQLKTHYKVA